MVGLALLVTFAACSDQAADSPLASIWDLENVPLSEELRPYFEDALATLAVDHPERPDAALLKQWCRLNLACERPDSRQTAVDSLFFLLKADPHQFLWIDLIIQNAYLIADRHALDFFDNTPPWNDTDTAPGSFWWGCSNEGTTRSESYFRQTSAHAAELDSLANIILMLKLAGCDSQNARHSAATRLLLSELTTARAVGGPDLELLLWQDMARFLTNGGHLDDALQAAVLAMALAEKADSPFRFTESRLILAQVLAARQETDAAQQQWAACIAETEAADYPFLAKVSRSEAAVLASTRGDFEGAIRHNQQVLDRVRADGDWLNEPRVMVNIADDYRRLGRPDSSLALLQRARRLVHDSGSPRNIAEFQIYEAEHYSFVGNYARAESLLAAAGGLIPGISPTEREATFLATQLQVAMESDNADLAYRTIVRIQEMGSRFFDERVDQNVVADLEIATADLLARQGEFRRSAEALARARTFVERGGGQDKEWELHRSLGELSSLREDLPAARAAFARCLEIALAGDNQDLVTRSRFGLAWTLMEMAEYGKARELFQERENASAFGGRFRTYLSKELLLGVAWSREGDPAAALNHFDAALDRCNEHSPPVLVANLRAERGLALIDLGRLREGETELLAARQLLARPPDGTQAEELLTVNAGTVRAVAEHLLSLWYANPELLGVKDPAAKTLRWAGQTVWQNLNTSRPYREEIGQDNSLVLAYFVGRGQSFLWTVNDGKTRWFALPDRETLQTILQPVLFDLVRPGRQVDWAAMQRLGQVLLGPVRDHWPAGAELRILADDILWSVPWLALPWPDSDPGDSPTVVMDLGNVWVLPGWPIADSTRDRRIDPALTPAGLSLLAVGFDGDDAHQMSGAPPVLHQAEAEALQIAALWHHGPAQTLVGEEASWAGLMDLDLDRFDVIHLSSHVVAYQGAPERSTLRLGGDPDAPPLTIPEIRNLALGAELVFLSCCEAARPLSRGGGGVGDFAGAFVRAGAAAVIASGQIVDDEASALLSSRFYYYWLDGRGTAAALRAALSDLREQEAWEHPFFWGNYRIIGY